MPLLHLANILPRTFQKDKSLSDQLALGSGGAFAVKMVALASAFFLQVLLARILGLEGFGIYIYALTWMNFGALLGRLGMDTASVKLVSAYKATQALRKLSGFLLFSRRFALSFGLGAGITSLALFNLIDSPVRESLIHPIWIACLVLTPLNALIFTMNAQLRGFKCIARSQAANDVVRPLFVILIMAFIYYTVQTQVSAVVALFTHVFSALLVLIIMHRLLKKYRVDIPDHSHACFEYRHWILTAIPFFFIALANLVMAQADILILGLLSGPTEAGLYAPARRIGNLITIVLTSVNTIAAPLFSELYAQGKIDDLQHTVRMAAKWIFAFSVPICIGVIVFAAPLLLLFGPDFRHGYQALQIIAGAQLVNALAGSVGFLMIMSGQQNKASLLMVLCALLNIVLNFLLIPTHGIMGAAWANFITTVLWNFIMLVFTVKLLSINPTIFGTWSNAS